MLKKDEGSQKGHFQKGSFGGCSPVQKLLPALLQKLIGEFFLFFAGKFGGKFGGNFAGFFLTHRIKAQTFRGNFRSIFRKKIRSSKKKLACIIHSADVGVATPAEPRSEKKLFLCKFWAVKNF